MFAARRLSYFRSLFIKDSRLYRRGYSESRIHADDSGMPLRPTWSVHDLLSSYPRPTLPAATLARLHELAALIPPEDGTPEHDTLTREMEEMIKLVDAVRLVDVAAIKPTRDMELGKSGKVGISGRTEDVPDGRVWKAGAGIALSSNTREMEFDRDELAGTDLLKHASRTVDGFYVVESDRSRKNRPSVESSMD